MSAALGQSFCNLTCGKCGHEADFGEFTRTPVCGDLPPAQYQCPSCRYAWRMVAKGKGKHYESGLYIPPDRVIETIAARL